MKTVFVGLHTRNLGTESRQVTNPFTGECHIAYRDKGMSPKEIEASSALLVCYGANDPDPDGFRKVVFPGGSYVEIDLGPVTAEIHVEGGLTPPVAAFVFRLAQVSGMLVCSTIDPSVVAVLPGQHHAGIEARWPDFASVGSVDELVAWIKREIELGHIVG